MRNKAVKTKNFKKSAIRRVIELGVLVVLFVVLYLLSLNQKVCEFFATTISRLWITVFGNVFGWIPISFYELFLIIAILGAIAFLIIEIVLLAKKKWQKALTALLIVAISVFSFLNVYTLSASFAYNRNPLPEYVYKEYSGNDLTLEEAAEIAKYVINETNSAYYATEHDAEGNIVYPYKLREMSNHIAEEYKRLDDGYFSSYTPVGKRIINKTIMSELGISGVFFAPFGEANINGIETGLFLPHTLAHEMAHGKGVMREYEADLVASYVLLTSNDPYLRYGALVQCMTTAINMVSLYPNSAEIVSQLNKMLDPNVISEWSRDSRKWSEYDTLDRIGEFLNDLYLKLQKQENGTDSYSKPGEHVDTGEKDNDGESIVVVLRFYDMQNLLINLYKQGKLT